MSRGSSRRTIVFCGNSQWGLVNFRGRVIQSLVQDGHRVVLVGPRDTPAERINALGAESAAWEIQPRSAHVIGELSMMLALRRLYRRIKPDLAFHFTIKPVLYGAMASRLMGVPSISVVPGLGYVFLERNWKTRLANLLYRHTLHWSREVWFLNKDDHRVFSSLGLIEGVRTRTLPGEGIDIGRFPCTPLPASNDRFVFLMVARLVKDKGVVEFAEAAQRVRAIHPRAVFRLLGPTYSADKMSVPMATIQEWGRAGFVEYLGTVDDVRPLIAESHCVVLPSYREGVPRVLMEAAAMGRPAIASDVAGCRDVVIDGETGLLCASQDAAALARTCAKVLAMSDDALASMGRRAHASITARFDDKAVISVYREAITLLDP